MTLKNVALLAAIVGLSNSAVAANQWSVSRNGALLQINYGTPANSPQYAVLDLNSSYFRMNYGPTSGWGTSIDTMPCYWSGGALFQGYAVTASTSTQGRDFVLTVDGRSNTLSTRETITISPPSNNSIVATVKASTSGSVTLDNRTGEAFKPVFLSSMWDSATSWDASRPFVGTTALNFPTTSGWIVSPAPVVSNTHFGLLGGTSTWKTNAPAVTIDFGNAIQVAGWISADSNPNDDNVGYWCASSTVLKSWTYKITVNGATTLGKQP